MTAKEVICNFERLPADEQHEVIDWVNANLSGAAVSKSEERMNIQHAEKHIFTTHRDVLEEPSK
jgi:hypothetical protein